MGTPPQKASADSDKKKQPAFKASKDDLKSLEGRYYSAECGGNYTLYVKDDKLWLNDHVNTARFLTPIGKNLKHALYVSGALHNLSRSGAILKDHRTAASINESTPKSR